MIETGSCYNILISHIIGYEYRYVSVNTMISCCLVSQRVLNSLDQFECFSMFEISCFCLIAVERSLGNQNKQIQQITLKYGS